MWESGWAMPPRLPSFVVHADWGSDPSKRQVARAELAGDGSYLLTALAPADPPAVAAGELRRALHLPLLGGALIGFDFPIGLPLAYASRVGVASFPQFLASFGEEPFHEFASVAAAPEEVSLFRPFYPHRPGSSRRDHLHLGLGLSGRELRRRCEGDDA